MQGATQFKLIKLDDSYDAIIFSDSYDDGHLAKQKICAEHLAEIRPFVKQCRQDLVAVIGVQIETVQELTTSLHFHMPN